MLTVTCSTDSWCPLLSSHTASQSHFNLLNLSLSVTFGLLSFTTSFSPQAVHPQKGCPACSCLSILQTPITSGIKLYFSDSGSWKSPFFPPSEREKHHHPVPFLPAIQCPCSLPWFAQPFAAQPQAHQAYQVHSSQTQRIPFDPSLPLIVHTNPSFRLIDPILITLDVHDIIHSFY